MKRMRVPEQIHTNEKNENDTTQKKCENAMNENGKERSSNCRMTKEKGENKDGNENQNNHGGMRARVKIVSKKMNPNLLVSIYMSSPLKPA